MPWPVYSERLLSSNNQAGWQLATVPAGKRALITDISIVNFTAAANQAQVAINQVAVANHLFQVNELDFHRECRLVAYAGESYGVWLQVTGLAGTLCGYLLDDPVGRTALPPTVTTLPGWPEGPLEAP